MSQPLRKCRKCGLEANTKEDLELFVKRKNRPHGHDNLCSKCRNEYNRQWYKLNPLVDRYYQMNARCENPKHPVYAGYGGRGITVCEEWRNDRQVFIDWANANGFKPELSLDRVDNDGPYSPENCRWTTRLQQMRNTRNNITNWEKETRICTICKSEKPLTGFHRNRSRTLGHQSICKECRKECQRKEYQRRKRRQKSSSKQSYG